MNEVIREVLNFLFLIFLRKDFVRTKNHKKHKKHQKTQKKHKNATKQKAQKTQISEQK